MFSRQSPARQHALRAPVPVLGTPGPGQRPLPPGPGRGAAHGRRSARRTCPCLAGECVPGERSERSSREKERSTYRQRSFPAAELPPAHPAQPGPAARSPLGAG